MATATESSRFSFSRNDGLSVEDFETASIRSAAPSYTSDAPSYHSTVPTAEVIPAYSPPANNSVGQATSLLTGLTRGADIDRGESSTPQPRHQRTIGLPPVPTRGNDLPLLSQFRIPTWSTVHSNPTLSNVAQRRVNKDASNAQSSARRAMLDRVVESEEENRLRDFRPLEDPYLVGEAAAARARSQRLARESGDDILLKEDQRWDLFLIHMKDWDDRERSWTRFRNQGDGGQRKKLGRRLAGRLL